MKLKTSSYNRGYDERNCIILTIADIILAPYNWIDMTVWVY